MVPITKVLDPANWFVAMNSALQSLKTGGTEKTEVKSSRPQDPQALKQVETKGGVATEPKPSEALLKLQREVHKFERAALLARTETQRQHYYQKAQKIWRQGVDKIPSKELFGDSRHKVLEEKFYNGGDIQKIQAGLWIIDTKYGHMLGSFGFLGMDGWQNRFTDKAIEKFRQDYNAGLIYGVPKPEKPLANAKEAKAEILRLAEACANSKGEDDWKFKPEVDCPQARTNLSNPKKDVADRAYTVYFFGCERLTKDQAYTEAVELRKMIDDPTVGRDVRHSAMHLYWKIARIHPLPETELTASLDMMKRMAADEKTESLLKSNAEEMLPTFAEKLAPFKAEPFDEEEEEEEETLYARAKTKTEAAA